MVYNTISIGFCLFVN